MQTTLDDTIDRYVRTLPILIMALLACTPESTPTWSYVEPLGRDELLESFAEEACGPEQLDYRAIGWPRLAGELTWAILLLRHDPPQGLNEFRDAVTGYYETLRIFAEQQDRALKVDESLFLSDPAVLQKRMEVGDVFKALSESDQMALRWAGCGFD